MSTYLFSTSRQRYDEVISVESLCIELFTPNIDFDKYNYLIISSKQIASALKNYELKDFISKKALCVSQKSAESFLALGGEVLDVAQGYGDSFLDTIKNYPKTTRWLYLRGAKVASDFAQNCRDMGYKIDEIVLYESRCSDAMALLVLPKEATLIFTSPSSVRCFLELYKLGKDHNVIVIGKTTAQALPNNITYKIAQSPTIEACLALI